MKIADAATAAGGNFSFNGATIKNVENIEVTTNGSFDVGANTGLSLTGFTGLTSATLKAAGTDNSMVIASSTTDVNLTVAGTATAETSGGKAIAITAGSGTTNATGSAIASVSITGGGVATVTDTSTAVTSLKSVSFTGVNGATAAITGNALADVSLKNQISAFAATLTNATSTSLNVNVDGVGYTTVGGSNSQLLCNPFVSQRLTRVSKPSKRPLPTTFLPQKAYFQSYRIFSFSFQRLSRVTYLYRRNLQPIRRTNYLPTEAI